VRLLNEVRALGKSATPGPPCAGPPKSNARSRRAVRPDTDADRSRALGGRFQRNHVQRSRGGQSRPDRTRTTLVLDCANVPAAIYLLAGGPGVPMGCGTSFTAFILEHHPGVRPTGRNVQLIWAHQPTRESVRTRHAVRPNSTSANRPIVKGSLG
jgi:hypothetical protein